MPSLIYNSFKLDSMIGNIDFSADEFNVVLVTNGYIPDVDNHTKYSDITNEIIAVGYTTSGQTLTGVVVSVDNLNDRALLNANDVVWTTATITNAAGAIIYKIGDSPNTSNLVCYIAFDTLKSSLNGNFIIQWNTDGIISLN